MGYSTDFAGVLTFKNMLDAVQIARLSKVLGEDIRDLDDEISRFFVDANFDGFYINLEFTPEFDGLKWNEAEKTHGMVGAVNGIINYMKAEFFNFELEGEMFAQGDDTKDKWKLKIISNGAFSFPILIDTDISQYVKCPECGHEFKLGEDE
jgi:hypothetical protein